MPAYNAERSIDESIRSVLAQRGVVFELLVGDDGSTDGTWQRIESYRNDARVRSFRFSKNRGVACTRNLVLRHARGRYISSCDADDILLPGNLRILSKILDNNPAIGVAYGNLIVKTGRRRFLKRRIVPGKMWDLLGGCFADGGSMIRRSLLKKVGGFDPEFKYLEDCDLFLRLSEVTEFYFCPGKPLYCQKKSAGSLSDKTSVELKKVSRVLLQNAIQRRYGHRIKW